MEIYDWTIINAILNLSWNGSFVIEVTDVHKKNSHRGDIGDMPFICNLYLSSAQIFVLDSCKEEQDKTRVCHYCVSGALLC